MHKNPPELGFRAKVLLAILCGLILYGTLRPECRGWQIEQPPQCVD